MCTLEKRGNIYILTLTGDDEHRLSPALLDSITAAIHRIHSETTTTPSALITTAHGKFFSNGFDLTWAQNDPKRYKYMDAKLQVLVRDLICLPMPTIAAVTGHASGAGFVLAQAHDYVMMRKDRGFLYMSEMDIKIVVPDCFVRMLKNKIGYLALRDVMMRGDKVTAEVAVAKGVIYSVHDNAEETVEAAVKYAEELVMRNWDGHVYACNRKKLFADVLAAMDADETLEDMARANGVSSRL
ncbi:delta(3), delta(2)-enoyl CoA isomerase 1 [Artemisia annua]|uniref:Delta(3)-Delta(2)-enoyl-CoA isomerase n=1 Tax=Artemisia annua TaxID=35608 RepID=A0A2U1PXE6_ARTAN|nr:delta(3), delta(2)-enoyl CoA isomerase 1 [Artemisia annua]